MTNKWLNKYSLRLIVFYEDFYVFNSPFFKEVKGLKFTLGIGIFRISLHLNCIVLYRRSEINLTFYYVDLNTFEYALQYF